MTDIERMIAIGELLWEAKKICDDGENDDSFDIHNHPRLKEIIPIVNKLHSEMSKETLDFMKAQDFLSEVLLHAGRGAM